MKGHESLIKELSETYRYKAEIVERWVERFGLKRAESLLKALKEPEERKVYRVNRLRAEPEYVRRIFVDEGWETHIHSVLKDLVLVRIKGPFNIDSKPPKVKTVVADKFAAESVLLGSDLFAPGVLKADKVRKGDEVLIADKYGFIVAKGVAEMQGREMVEIPSIQRSGVAARTTSSFYESPSIRGTHLYEKGLVYAQSLPAALAVYNLEPKKGEIIVDLCAAPGGKTTQVAELTNNDCRLIAIEKKRRRIKELKQNLERMGASSCVIAVLEDARYFAEEYNVKADRVIVDPSCSGFGIRPCLHKETKIRDVEGLGKYSCQLVRAGSKLLKNGGRMVYSTCTLEPEENELVVNYAVNELGLKLQEQRFFFGEGGEAGDRVDFDTSLVQRFYPDINATPGFFIAILELSK